MKMRRREFITLLGGAAAAWPLAAGAQQAVPVIGYLANGIPGTSPGSVAAFYKGLSETGFVEGRNVAIEYRWAHNDINRLPELAADLVNRRVTVIATPGSVPAALAAKAATTTIPIVFWTGTDPVRVGIVPSLNRPGGNITGFTPMDADLGPKRLGLLNEFLPPAARVAVLVNPGNAAAPLAIADLRAAATAIDRDVEFFNATSNGEIDTAFADLAQRHTGAVLLVPDTLFANRVAQLVTLAARYTLPAMYWRREFVDFGGLMTYGAPYTDAHRQVGLYVGRILKGEKPADLPVMRATKFEFVINLQAAKLLGLAIPPTLLAIADEVIE